MTTSQCTTALLLFQYIFYHHVPALCGQWVLVAGFIQRCTAEQTCHRASGNAKIASLRHFCHFSTQNVGHASFAHVETHICARSNRPRKRIANAVPFAIHRG